MTVLCVLLALPMAFFMAKVAAPRWRPLLVALVLTPLWASLPGEGLRLARDAHPEGGFVDSARRSAASPGYGLTAIVIVLTYLWLPYMILPVYAGDVERCPSSLLDASADLGAGSWRTFRDVVLPLIFPSHRRRVDLHVLAEPR